MDSITKKKDGARQMLECLLNGNEAAWGEAGVDLLLDQLAQVAQQNQLLIKKQMQEQGN